jgi:hypothetical protein
MEIEKRIYPAYAFTENEREKSIMNSTIYKELKEKYRISRYKVDNLDDYDIVLDCKPDIYRSTYKVIKNNTQLSDLELALICDDGSLCFGYSRHGNKFSKLSNITLRKAFHHIENFIKHPIPHFLPEAT